jgi:methionine-rich copper-binding protein CopC
MTVLFRIAAFGLLGMALGAGLVFTAPAWAAAALVSSTPADGSAGPAPASISLTFNDRLAPAQSTLALSMPGMKMPPMAAALSADGKTLTANPQGGWMKGVYQIHWHAVGSDGAPAQGAISFTVK